MTIPRSLAKRERSGGCARRGPFQRTEPNVTSAEIATIDSGKSLQSTVKNCLLTLGCSNLKKPIPSNSSVRAVFLSYGVLQHRASASNYTKTYNFSSE